MNSQYWQSVSKQRQKKIPLHFFDKTKFFVNQWAREGLWTELGKINLLNQVVSTTLQCYRGKWKKRAGAALLEILCSEGTNAWVLLVPLHHVMEREAWLGGKGDKIFNKVIQFCCEA